MPSVLYAEWCSCRVSFMVTVDMLIVIILSVVGPYTYVSFIRHLVKLEQGEDCLKNVNYAKNVKP
jgi:hypothetical protein